MISSEIPEEIAIIADSTITWKDADSVGSIADFRLPNRLMTIFVVAKLTREASLLSEVSMTRPAATIGIVARIPVIIRDNDGCQSNSEWKS